MRSAREASRSAWRQLALRYGFPHGTAKPGVAIEDLSLIVTRMTLNAACIGLYQSFVLDM